MSVTFFKLILIFEYKSMIVNLNATICDANNVSETNAIRRIHACKKNFYLPSSIPLWLIPFLILLRQSWLWHQLMQGFLGGLDPISSIRSTLALHLTFRLKLLMNVDELALEIVYLIHLLIY